MMLRFVTILVFIATLLCARAVFASSNYAVRWGRVCVNEDSRPLRPLSDGGSAGEPTLDCLAIHQTSQSFARWKKTAPFKALGRLAPHVSGVKLTTNPRHLAYGALPALGGVRPAPWVEAVFGDWRVHGPFWVVLRENLQRLLAEDGVSIREGPCNGSPIAWGGPMDEAIAIARGLVKLDCGQTVNSFWALPEKTISAEVAAGERR